MNFGSTKFSRRKLLGGAAAAGATIPVLHEVVPHQGLHNTGASAAEHLGHVQNAHRASGHLGARGQVDPRVNGFDPQ
ncbi:MAG TPA: twin-arginine translocation signal domain-containing protein, partial [Thermoleophilaceae bacterium]|nr:twin-arginine translocation signal domain-containing protein [Thermoleophilaceae bacterium]